MRLNNYASRNDLFVDWILESTPQGCAILDVGASDGTFCPEVKRIAQHAGRFAGVDPDVEKLKQNRLISERYYSALEDAEIPPASFDALYCFFVFEHVAHEERFLEAAARALKPGGKLFFITPNGHHYFVFLASLFGKLGLQRRMLGLLTGGSGLEWHYPAEYRLNCPKDIERIGKKHGFDRFQFRYCERLDEVSEYFPGPTIVFPRLWQKAAAASRRDTMLVTLIGQMDRAADPTIAAPAAQQPGMPTPSRLAPASD
jgi:ubiquinone/menaquinone biosynthesis C-methylase UbiE